MFVSQVGPRAQPGPGASGSERRLIRLSLPLLQDQPDQEVVGTLAHEMIHQWQYDILKRRPNHGPEFYRMMAVMNRGGLGITIRHSLDTAVYALTKYTWRCVECGRDYHRQRRTIRPGQHRCGECFGTLHELPRAPAKGPLTTETSVASELASDVVPMLTGMATRLVQMPLPFSGR